MTVSALVYGPDGVTTDAEDPDLAAARRAAGTTWVHVTETGGAFERVADAFEIHPLVVEDVLGDVRPKTEEYGAYTFVLVKAATLTRGETSFDQEIRRTPVGIVFGDDWLVTFAGEPVGAVERVRGAVRREDGRLLHQGPDFAAYRVVDGIVDAYFGILDDLETDIEAIEEAVLVSTDIETLEAINELRRDLLSFRKLAWPSREAVGVLARGDPDHVDLATEKYFRDVYDHLVQVVDLVEIYRDLTTGARDIYQNTLAQSTNDVMKTLTVVATVVLPLTLVAGIFGMNFETMPELGWPYAYYAVLVGMGLVAAVLVTYFRRLGYI